MASSAPATNDVYIAPAIDGEALIQFLRDACTAPASDGPGTGHLGCDLVQFLRDFSTTAHRPMVFAPGARGERNGPRRALLREGGGRRRGFVARSLSAALSASTGDLPPTVVPLRVPPYIIDAWLEV